MKGRKLSDIPKKEPFDAPADYFDALPNRILQKIEDQPKQKTVRLETWHYVSIGVAASLAIVILVLTGDFTAKSTAPSDLISQLDTEDCLAYLESLEVDPSEMYEDGTSIDLTDIESSNDTMHVTDEYMDILFEKYGVSEDDKL